MRYNIKISKSTFQHCFERAAYSVMTASEPEARSARWHGGGPIRWYGCLGGSDQYQWCVAPPLSVWSTETVHMYWNSSIVAGDTKRPPPRMQFSLLHGGVRSGPTYVLFNKLYLSLYWKLMVSLLKMSGSASRLCTDIDSLRFQPHIMCSKMWFLHCDERPEKHTVSVHKYQSVHDMWTGALRTSDNSCDIRARAIRQCRTFAWHTDTS